MIKIESKANIKRHARRIKPILLSIPGCDFKPFHFSRVLVMVPPFCIYISLIRFDQESLHDYARERDQEISLHQGQCLISGNVDGLFTGQA
ncbi:MAG: hypothetical protein ACFFCS_27920 [Candidatus Hodarchaeota archaeon]